MQNFGKIKNAFNNLLIEAIVRENPKGKQLFSSYVKAIKENKILRTQFLIYNNLETKVESNELKANLFLQENLNLLKQFSKKEILEANTKLASKIKNIEEVVENKDLYENIATLIFTERLSENIDKIVDATAKIIEHIKDNKIKETVEAVEVPVSMLAGIMVEKYNTKYSDIDETEYKIVKTLIESNDEQKVIVYEEIKRECIDLINLKLNETTIDIEGKSKLLMAKDKLLNDKIEVNEDYLTTISKLVELRNNLK